jgi:hypothetical protein
LILVQLQLDGAFDKFFQAEHDFLPFRNVFGC